MIGSVSIDLNPLLLFSATDAISGWFPICTLLKLAFFPIFSYYFFNFKDDTLQGVRGALHVTVKSEFLGNVNPYSQGSTGVKFFSIAAPLSSYAVESVIGLVDELVWHNDPEYAWLDSFRAARTSNEERQVNVVEKIPTKKNFIGIF